MFSLIKNAIRKHSSIDTRKQEGYFQEIPEITSKAVDIALIMDSSTSMLDNDPQNIRKNAAINLVNALNPEDRASVIEFGIYSRVLCGLTNNKGIILNAINQTVPKEEGTYIDKAIKSAIAEIVKNANRNHRAIILFTDGGGRYDEKLNITARRANIKIFTVGLGSKVKTYLLQSIALKTGGKYLHASSAHELLEIFQRLQKTIRIMAENDGRLLLN